MTAKAQELIIALATYLADTVRPTPLGKEIEVYPSPTKKPNRWPYITITAGTFEKFAGGQKAHTFHVHIFAKKMTEAGPQADLLELMESVEASIEHFEVSNDVVLFQGLTVTGGASVEIEGGSGKPFEYYGRLDVVIRYSVGQFDFDTG